MLMRFTTSDHPQTVCIQAQRGQGRSEAIDIVLLTKKNKSNNRTDLRHPEVIFLYGCSTD